MSESVDLFRYERAALARGEIVVGLDEVGRGALAGPLAVGAVVIRNETPPPARLTDSKALTARVREQLVSPLRDWCADWSIGWVSNHEIDQWGLRLALAVAATRALESLHVQPTYAVLDGNFNLLSAPTDVALGVEFPPPLRYATMPHECIVKGDAASATIAAASVLAKVARDALMVELDAVVPGYGFAGNMGYGAAAHLAAIRELGPSGHHRVSWNLPTGPTS